MPKRARIGTTSTMWDTNDVIKSLIDSAAAAAAEEDKEEAESNPPPSDAVVVSSSPHPHPPPSSSSFSSASSAPLVQEPMIVTFCQEFDMLLGGGFRVGDVTEIVGLPGTGKTQLLMQLCLNVQLHSLLGGCEGEAIIIDAEGAVSTERLSQMADAISLHVRKVTRRFSDKDRSDIRAVASTAELLSGVHIARALNLQDLTSTISSLYEYLSLNPKIKLVCIDSIACHLRYGHLAASSNPRPRTGLVLQLAQSLNAIAERFGVAIIATNHMTTRFINRNKWSSKAGAKS
jgi:RecA/RadA recombinase